MENIYITIGIFFTLQVINVILNTAKTLIMTRTNNPHLSAVINAITFGFYAAVVKQIAGLDLTITITITVVTNVIGVYLTYWIAGKLQKDNLWKIEIYSKNADGISTQLELRSIPIHSLTLKSLPPIATPKPTVWRSRKLFPTTPTANTTLQKLPNDSKNAALRGGFFSSK